MFFVWGASKKILANQATIIALIGETGEETMAAIDDLNTVVAAIKAEQAIVATAVAAGIADIASLSAKVSALQAQIASAPNQDAAIAAATAALSDVKSGLDAQAAALTAAVTPAA